MRALKSHAKILGLTAALLAGTVLISVDDAAAKGMGGMHGSMSSGRSPALATINKPGGNSYSDGHHHDGNGHHHDKDRKADRKHCKKSITCEKKWGGNPPRAPGSTRSGSSGGPTFAATPGTK
jgi:hypothetical protein